MMYLDSTTLARFGFSFYDDELQDTDLQSMAEHSNESQKLVSVSFVDLTADDEVKEVATPNAPTNPTKTPSIEPVSSNCQELLLVIDQYNDQQSPSASLALLEPSSTRSTNSTPMKTETESSESSCSTTSNTSKKRRGRDVTPGEFFCEKCKRNFISSRGLKQHINTHHSGIKAHGCDICGKRFELLDEMKKHRERHSAENKRFECRFSGCTKRFMYRTDIERHVAVRHGKAPHCCEICGKGFGRKDHLDSHKVCHKFNTKQSPSASPALSEPSSTRSTNSTPMKTETESSEASSSTTSNKPKKRRGRPTLPRGADVTPGEFFCEKCKRNFLSSRGLKQHINTHHTGIKAHGCDICGKRFDLLDEMKKHRERHSAENKPHECGIGGCTRRFIHRKDMERHVAVRHGKAQHCCEICGKGFGRKDHLDSHKVAHKFNTMKRKSSIGVYIFDII